MKDLNIRILVDKKLLTLLVRCCIWLVRRDIGKALLILLNLHQFTSLTTDLSSNHSLAKCVVKTGHAGNWTERSVRVSRSQRG